MKSGIVKSNPLFAEPKFFEDRSVAIELFTLEVVEELATTCCHCDKSTA